MQRIAIFLTLTFLLAACANEHTVTDLPKHTVQKVEKHPIPKTKTVESFPFANFPNEAKEWGENVSNVKTSFETNKKEIALTFDACGGELGNDVDEDLINFLKAEKIPATLFVNKRWAEHNNELFKTLANDPLFEIANHGTEHKPLSIDGGEAWGIEATKFKEEAFREIMENDAYINEQTGKQMTLFRSGTAYYDEVAVSIANELNYEIVNYDILGDAGATYSEEQVRDALLQASPGSIALLHMNQPTSGTAAGVKMAIPELQEEGFEFVHIDESKLK